MRKSKSLGYIYRNPGRAVWMMKYFQHGRRIRKTTGTEDKTEALAALHAATTDAGRGVPTEAKVGKITFDAAAADLLTDYANNNYDSEPDADGRIRNHLTPFFGGRKLTTITTPLVNTYIQQRRKAKAKNGTINRELALLKRMFTLAQRAGLIVARPYISKLDEHNVRKGFFEEDAFANVCRRLTPEIAAVATMAYLTGWRIASEILPLEWRQVEFASGTVTLDPDTTKNDEPRVFPVTDDLRVVLEARQVRRDAMLARGQVCPWVFFREVAPGRRGLSPQHRAHAAVGVQPKADQTLRQAMENRVHRCQRAGPPAARFRRTAIRNMSRRGVPERVAMTLTGHKTRSVFDRYRIVNDRFTRRAARG